MNRESIEDDASLIRQMLADAYWNIDLPLEEIAAQSVERLRR